MKAFILPVEMRNAIVQALGECPNKYVGAPVNWLMSLQITDIQTEPPETPEISDLVKKKHAGLEALVEANK